MVLMYVRLYVDYFVDLDSTAFAMPFLNYQVISNSNIKLLVPPYTVRIRSAGQNRLLFSAAPRICELCSFC